MEKFRFTQYLYVVTALLIPTLFSSGCTVIELQQNDALKARQHNTLLVKENKQLNSALDKKNVLMAKLQMELTRRQEEIDRLTITQSGLTREIDQKTVRVPPANTKVETVAYLAEIATEISTLRDTGKPDDEQCFQNAELLLLESYSELEDEHFEHSASLAAKAMALVNTIRFNADFNEEDIDNAAYMDFIAPLDLKLAKRSNIRKAPGKQSKLITTVGPGTSVSATGHKGNWIKVVMADGNDGWIYSPLLSVPEKIAELK